MAIETKRLRFRPWTEADAEALFKYASDPDVGPRAGWPPHTSVEDSLSVIRTFFANDHTWALVLKETGEPVGCMGYYIHGESNIGIGENDAELGYWIAKPYWNQGLCTEALRAMIDYCFNKKGVDLFERLWLRYIGPCKIVYTRSAEGRKVLLKARKYAFSASKLKKSKRLSKWQ